jgi:hypothetical protein
VACWAHARRNIYEVYESTASPPAKEALERIADLFAIEARINGRSPAERLAVRQQEAVPLLTELKSFLDKVLTEISGKSTLAKAIRYALARWTALTRLHHADHPIQSHRRAFALELPADRLTVDAERFRRRTPAPPPFSSINSTPAFLSTATINSRDFWSPAAPPQYS